MKKMLCALIVMLAVMTCHSQAVETLVRLWETADGLQVPESVLYHPDSQTLFVSNINGKPTEKNGRGFISRLSLTGEILQLKWATGLDAPKGAAIYGQRLYVSDIDRLVEIDLVTGDITAAYPAPGAVFLNDVAADRAGNIYVSDMDEQQSAVWRLSGKTFAVWLKTPEIRSPNGLHMEEDKLMVGNSGDGTIKSVRLSDQTIVNFAVVGSGIDGLRPDGKGNFIVSDWKGATRLVPPAGPATVLLDTTDAGIQSADLEYVADKKLLLIPTFFNHKVVAFRWD
ncbi:hypothetical protein JCM14469_11190 [Desulfatiferula olefinivorans]